MTNSQRLAAVRARLQQWYTRQHGEEAEPPAIVEAILIRDGFYCGRKFNFGDYRAVWFLEEEQVKIHRADGAVVECFSTAANPAEEAAPEQPTLKMPVRAAVEPLSNDDGQGTRRAA